MSVQTHAISINLRALEVELSLNIQRVSHFVLAALGSSRELLHSPLVANGRVVGFGYAPCLRWSRDEAQQEYDNWILQTGFRDLAEVTIPFLQVVQSLSATALLKELQDSNEHITPAQWREIVVDGERRFEKSNLPDKLTTLQNTYGLDFPADCLTQIVSIARARNCLVHRGGVVQRADVDEAGVLRVSWHAQNPYVVSDGKEAPLTLPYYAEAGAQVVVRSELSHKTFQLGQRVLFDAVEFAEIAFGFLLLGLHVVYSLELRLRRAGIRFSE